MLSEDVLQKAKIKWRFYYVLLFVRETAFELKRERRLKHVFGGLVSWRVVSTASISDCLCLQFLSIELETSSLHTLCKKLVNSFKND